MCYKMIYYLKISRKSRIVENKEVTRIHYYKIDTIKEMIVYNIRSIKL